MLMTEEQAVRKWCPMARAFTQLGNGTTAAATNRDTPNGNIPSCIASHCMAWRFHDPKMLKDIDLVTSDVVDLPPRRGYCGAFGPVHHEE